MLIKIKNGAKLEIKIGELFRISAMLVYPKSMKMSYNNECWGILKNKYTVFLGAGEYDTNIAGRGYARKLYFYVYIDSRKKWNKFHTYDWHIFNLESIAISYET